MDRRINKERRGAKMLEFIEKNKNYVLALAIFFVFVSLSEPTYSLFIKSDTIEDLSYETGLLDLEITEDEKIILETALPINDSEALNLKPYTLKIKNTGSLTYHFNLKMQVTNDNPIDAKYIKVKVNDNLPRTLYLLDNIIASDLVINPNEEMTFKINIWLDKDTPNAELGKEFTSRIITTGEAIYKTLDQSGANHPNLQNNLLPIYYDEYNNTWKKASSSNLDASNQWYDYESKLWANAATITDSPRLIYDITNKHHLSVSNLKSNNGNLIIDKNYLDLGFTYQKNIISVIMRFKINDLDIDKLSFITNKKTSYYYDVTNKQFVYTNGTTNIRSNTYDIDTFKWYTIGYTYDGTTFSMYVDGEKIYTNNLSGTIQSNDTFKIGTDNNSTTNNLIIDKLYIYNDILTPEEISSNFKSTINPIKDNLECGYEEFTPMTKKEYYLASPNGTIINNDDIKIQYVWIPRYKYATWNILGNAQTSNSPQLINVIFEKGTTTSGNIYCQNLTCYSDNLLTTKTTNDDNKKYYTHPSFSSENQQLTGFWVGKYEIGISSSCNNNECLTTDLSIVGKEGSIPWTNNYLANYYQAVKKLGDNYHLIKNTEWGAITYLTYSKYGLCQSNNCIENSNTTTNNETGIYNMASGSREFVMANLADNNLELSLENTHFNNIPINNNDYDLYYNNGFILGDATKEITINNTTTNYFDENNRWLVRGDNNSMFSYNKITDSNYSDVTSRIVLK